MATESAMNCDTCGITFNSSRQQEEHFVSPKHIRKSQTPSTDSNEAAGVPVLKESNLETEVVCKVCAVTFNSYDQAQQHYQGEKHAKKLEVLNNPSYEPFKSMDADKCDLCDLNFNSQVQAIRHYASPHHQEKLPPDEQIITYEVDENNKPIKQEATPSSKAKGGDSRHVSQSRQNGKGTADSETRCATCLLDFNSAGQAEQHYAGEKHAHKVWVMEKQEWMPFHELDAENCVICNMTFNSQVQAIQHYASPHHQDKLEPEQRIITYELDEDNKPIKPTRPDRKVNGDSEVVPKGAPKEKVNHIVKCETCDITLNSKAQADQHFTGKTHIRKLKGDPEPPPPKAPKQKKPFKSGGPSRWQPSYSPAVQSGGYASGGYSGGYGQSASGGTFGNQQSSYSSGGYGSQYNSGGSMDDGYYSQSTQSNQKRPLLSAPQRPSYGGQFGSGSYGDTSYANSYEQTSPTGRFGSYGQQQQTQTPRTSSGLYGQQDSSYSSTDYQSQYDEEGGVGGGRGYGSDSTSYYSQSTKQDYTTPYSQQQQQQQQQSSWSAGQKRPLFGSQPKAPYSPGVGSQFGGFGGQYEKPSRQYPSTPGMMFGSGQKKPSGLYGSLLYSGGKYEDRYSGGYSESLYAQSQSTNARQAWKTMSEQQKRPLYGSSRKSSGDPVSNAVYNNMMGTLPKKRRVDVPCTICKVVFNSQAQATAHFSGSKHKRRLTAVQEGKTEDDPKEKPDPAKTQPGKHTCSYCNISVNSFVQFEAHNQGTKHKSVLENLAKGLPGKTGGTIPKDDIAGHVSGLFYCSTCDVSMVTAVKLQQHITGEQHKQKKVQQQSQSTDADTTTPMATN